MLGRLFPRRLDNDYRGHWLGIVLFVLAAGLKAAQGIGSIVATRKVATGADGVALDALGGTYGADVVMSLFATLGMYLLVVPAFGLVALIRYRGMIPLVYLMLLATQLGTRLLHTFHPAYEALHRGGQPTGFTINMIILAVTVLGFGLSMTERRRHEHPASPA